MLDFGWFRSQLGRELGGRSYPRRFRKADFLQGANVLWDGPSQVSHRFLAFPLVVISWAREDEGKKKKSSDEAVRHDAFKPYLQQIHLAGCRSYRLRNHQNAQQHRLRCCRESRWHDGFRCKQPQWGALRYSCEVNFFAQVNKGSQNLSFLLKRASKGIS